DADFLQLIGSNINVVKTGRKSLEVIDAASFKRKYGFASDLYLDYLSLKGDASDNIKGIPGVGPKTAQNLIMNYGSLNNIYSNINCLQKRQKRLIENNRQVAESNMKFLRIITTISSTEFDLENTENISLVELNKPTNYLLAQVGIDTK
ncbi:MAG: polymerase protein, partial [candidate division WWE3 bacterium GW2011_GWC1_47_10]